MEEKDLIEMMADVFKQMSETSPDKQKYDHTTETSGDSSSNTDIQIRGEKKRILLMETTRQEFIYHNEKVGGHYKTVNTSFKGKRNGLILAIILMIVCLVVGICNKSDKQSTEQTKTCNSYYYTIAFTNCQELQRKN